MKKTQYIKYSRETSDLVAPIIDDILNETVGDESELLEIASFFYRERRFKILLKPILFRLSYEMCGGKKFSNFLYLAAAFEILNISSYQANSAFDNKMGTLSKEEKDNQFIASMISREMSAKAIHRIEQDNISKEIVNVLNTCISTSNMSIYKAQHYDLNLLSLYNARTTGEYIANRELFLRDYNMRCFLGSGFFSGQVAMAGAIAAGADKKEQEALRIFGEIYGTALHKINDFGDFFPGDDRQGKLYQDFFCDIRNGRLTFPVYELITKYNDSYQEIINLLKDASVNIERICSIISKLDITDSVRLEAVSAYRNAKKALEIFDESESKKLMLTLLSILDSNKYFYRAKR